jgi:hypothetical protein
MAPQRKSQLADERFHCSAWQGIELKSALPSLGEIIWVFPSVHRTSRATSLRDPPANPAVRQRAKPFAVDVEKGGG